jgi:hypothetical protein
MEAMIVVSDSAKIRLYPIEGSDVVREFARVERFFPETAWRFLLCGRLQRHKGLGRGKDGPPAASLKMGISSSTPAGWQFKIVWPGGAAFTPQQ